MIIAADPSGINRLTIGAVVTSKIAQEAMLG